ncbi:MAG TPA: alpha-isopropylmalate synthase regulatory domain-containing protein [Candidatus Saccharimonadales bacterium]|nr:alpha-isopropylmalate synthase regulatory domain-containing protein [Candidatus Saccharimonadales bacterium]
MPEPNSPEQLKPVKIFDTTLRDGIQATDVSATKANALYIAGSLAEAGVDIIEIGFPASNDGNLATVQHIAERVDGAQLAAFARTDPEDVAKAGYALAPAGDRARINICRPFSDLHIQKRLGSTREETVELAVRHTAQARELVDDVQFSFEDSTRAELKFLKESVLAVAHAGATTMMLPDTVGAMLPRDYSERLLAIREALDARGFGHVVIAAHCHNDRGQAVMSSLDALRFGGAEQVDVTIGGVGERNGNTPLEVVVGNLAVYPEMGLVTNVDPTKLRNLAYEIGPKALGDGARLPEKHPFVGEQSYAHGSGMHQHGVLIDELMFKDFKSAELGFDKPFQFKINDQSGKSGVRYELGTTLNMSVDEHTLQLITDAVKKRSTDRGGKNLGHNELEELTSEIIGEEVEDKFKLEAFSFTGDTQGDEDGLCTATVTINGQEKTVESKGGVVDAARQAIEELTGFEFNITGWHVDDLEEGSDAAVGIFATVKHNGYEVDTYARSKVSENAGADILMQAVNVIHRVEERTRGSAPEKAA